MSKTLRHLIWIVSLAAMGSGEAQRVGQGTTIRFGTVRNVQQVPLQSDAAAGAVVGGTIGLMAGGRRPARHALVGAAAGGAVTAAAQGNRTGFAYTVQLNDGSTVRIVSDQREIRSGDCVAVEQVGQTFTPDKAGTPNGGQVCHVAVKAKDYVFHPYQMR